MAALWISMIIIAIIIIAALILLDFYLGHKYYLKKCKPPQITRTKADLSLYMDGRKFFKALIEHIQQAESHIHLSFYIFRADQIGTELMNLLIKKRHEGIRVRLLLDRIGSHGFSSHLKSYLNKEGVEVAFSCKPHFPYFIYHLNHRNHRKIAVIDGKIAGLGGFNVGDEYLGRKAKFGDWRDYHMFLKGPAVHTLQKRFVDDWNEATGHTVKINNLFPAIDGGESEVTFAATAGSGLEAEWLNYLKDAKKRILIGSPYFVPSRNLFELLIEKLEAGVKVTLLLPAKKDHPLVKPVSYAYFAPLLKRGAEVFHYYQGFYHAKVMIVDHKSAYLGTANFDLRSLHLNDEMCAFFHDEKTIQKIEHMTRIDLVQSIPLTFELLKKRPWYEQIKTPLSRLFAPLL